MIRLIFVGHALSATWGLWIFVIAFYFRGADWKEDSMYQRKKHEQYLEDVEKKKARDKQKAYEAAKKKGKSKK